jgi:large-conductance mechanosensitive channel
MAKKKHAPKQKPITATQAENDTRPTLLSPSKVAAIARAEAKDLANKQVSGFTDFLREQSVISIGIGLVLGIQIKAVVDTIMASLVNPVTQLILPGQEALSSKEFMMTLNGKEVAIGWGAIVYSLFTFIMVAILIYAGYKLLRLDKLTKKKDEPAAVKEEKEKPKK